MRREPTEVRIVTEKKSHLRTPRTLDEAEFDNEYRPFDREDRLVFKGYFVIGAVGVIAYLIARFS